MKIAVLSDMHGNGIALQYTIEDLAGLGINRAVILGDVVMKGPMPNEVMNMLNYNGLEILGWIKGNTDLWFDEITDDWVPSTIKEEELYRFYKYAKDNLNEDHISFIRGLPLEHSFSVDNVNILCVHGTPKSIAEAIDGSVSTVEIRRAIEGVDERIILCGHSHVPFIGEVDGKRIFNAGSIGYSLDGDNRISYGILDISDGNVEMINRRISYPIDELLGIAAQRKFPNMDKYKNAIYTAQ